MIFSNKLFLEGMVSWAGSEEPLLKRIALTEGKLAGVELLRGKTSMGNSRELSGGELPGEEFLGEKFLREEFLGSDFPEQLLFRVEPGEPAAGESRGDERLLTDGRLVSDSSPFVDALVAAAVALARNNSDLPLRKCSLFHTEISRHCSFLKQFEHPRQAEGLAEGAKPITCQALSFPRDTKLLPLEGLEAVGHNFDGALAEAISFFTKSAGNETSASELWFESLSKSMSSSVSGW